MADLQSIRFNLHKITTDEFALTEEKYDPASNAEMKVGVGFNFIKEEKVIVGQIKCMFYQQGKLLMVIAVSCWFKIVQEDWEKIYQEENRTFDLPRAPALHLASLVVGTARGVLHAKTEKQLLNAVLIPPVYLQDIIKEDVKLPLKE
jgi:hypothetical protein